MTERYVTGNNQALAAHHPARSVDPTTAGTTVLVRQVGIVGLVALAAVVATVLAFALVNRNNTQWVLHTREVARLARLAMMEATDRQTGLRGYQVTGDSAFLAPEIAARPALPARLDTLVALTVGNPSQHARAREFRAAVDRWNRDIAAPALSRPPGVGGPAPTALRRDKALFDPVRRAYATFAAEEERLYAAGASRVDQMRWVMVTAILLELLALALGLFRLARRAERQVGSLEEQRVLLEEQAVELEVKIEEAESLVDELSASNDRLTEATDRRTMAEAAARDAEVTLGSVLDAAPVGIAIHARSGAILQCNAAFARQVGALQQDLAGTHVRDFAVRGLEELAPMLDRALRDGVPSMHAELLSPPGRDQRFWNVSCYPIHGAAGSITGAGTIIVETTEARQLEQQLLQSQKMDAVGQLAGGVAHDFNNLLTAILSYGQLLLDTFELGDKRRGDVAEIIRAGQSAAGLTRQLLTFSRQKVVHTTIIDLNDLVSTAENLLRRLLPASIVLRVERDPVALSVNADAGQLEQVLVNLVVNARDAMPEGGELTIRTTVTSLGEARPEPSSGEVAPPGRYAVLMVSDTGIGMDAATQARIFEPFFTTKEVGQGTGLGLATTFGIVKQAGGHIWVYSEPYQGTSFKIHLPLASAGVDARPDTPSNVLTATRHDRTILLVDDNPDVRAVTKRVLESHGYQVLDAAGPDAALVMLDAQAIEVHLLMTDIVMPQMDGLALAGEVSRRRPGVRVLFMSGYSKSSVERTHRLREEAAFIEKPFTPGELSSKVRAVLAGS